MSRMAELRSGRDRPGPALGISSTTVCPGGSNLEHLCYGPLASRQKRIDENRWNTSRGQ
jgi:hypothetical protein